MSDSVVIHNFHAVGTIVMPGKAHAPLIIDANAVLAFAVALQRLQQVARRNAKTVQFSGRVQLQQLAPSHPFNVFEPAHRLTVEQGLGVGTGERADHGWILI